MSRYDLALGRKSKKDPAKQHKAIVEEFQEVSKPIEERRRAREQQRQEEIMRDHRLGDRSGLDFFDGGL